MEYLPGYKRLKRKGHAVADIWFENGHQGNRAHEHKRLKRKGSWRVPSRYSGKAEIPHI
jgi:hypothetical protein